jgi:xanthosine utilization system XapX-like protein
MVSLRIVKRKDLKLVPRRYRIFGMLAMLFICIFVLVLPTSLIFKREMARNKKTFAVMNIDKDDMDPTKGGLQNRNQINVFLKVADVDLKLERMKVFVSFVPTGIFAQRGTVHPGTLNIQGTTPISIQLGDSNNQTVRSGDIISRMELNLPLKNGDVEDFPFDGFDSRVTVSLRYSDFPTQVPPVGLVADGSIQNFNIDPVIDSGVDNFGIPTTAVRFSIGRSSLNKGFAVFLIGMMWLLSLSAVGVAIDLIIRKEAVSESILGMLVGLLFALPALRNSIPGAPPIGAMIDILGFFWNMAFVGIAALMMMGWYLIKQTEAGLVVADDADDELDDTNVDKKEKRRIADEEMGLNAETGKGKETTAATKKRRESFESVDTLVSDEFQEHLETLEKTLDKNFPERNHEDITTASSSGQSQDGPWNNGTTTTTTKPDL